MGQRQAMHLQLQPVALLQLRFCIFFIQGQHLTTLCTILLLSLNSTVQPGVVPLANMPGPGHSPLVPSWTSPCPGMVPLAFGASSSKPVLLPMQEAADDGDDLIRASGLFPCRWHRYQHSRLRRCADNEITPAASQPRPPAAAAD